jgi:hypothetical protein
LCSSGSLFGECLVGDWRCDFADAGMAGEAWAKVDGIGGTGTLLVRLPDSDSMTKRIALGVAGSPITGPLRFAYMLLPALGSTLALRDGRSSFLGGWYVVLGSSMSVVSGAGVISSGCIIGGAEGLLASDIRRASSSRAAASFFSCLSSLMTFRSPEPSVTSCIGAGVGSGAPILRRGAPSEPTCDGVRRTSDFSRAVSRVDHAVFDRTDTGDAAPSPLLTLLALRLFLRRNFSRASTAFL